MTRSSVWDALTHREGVIDHDQAIAKGSNDLAAPPPFALSELDIRRKHDSVVTFILGRGVMRRATRVLLLLAFDFVGVMGAIYTALLLKSLLNGNVNFATAWDGTHSSIAIAYLIVALIFARVDAYADRARRPGLARITIALAQATVVGLIFELASGTHFNSYYLFYGIVLLRDRVHRHAARAVHEGHRLAAGARRISPSGGAGRLGRCTSPRWRMRWAAIRAPTGRCSATSR